MIPLKSIAVFCGSSKGSDPVYMKAAADLGREMCNRKMKLVYGGGTVGLMGEIASTVQSISGDSAVIGVIPEAMVPREVSGNLIGDTRVVADMHQRKAQMAAEADAFIGLPGGYGTMEELMEMITWQTLGYHSKPVGLLNISGFYDKLLDFFDHCVHEGFIRESYRPSLLVGATPAELIDKLEAYVPPTSVFELKKEAGSAPKQ